VHAAAGGVGSLAGQFARLAGAESIVGVVTTPELAAFARDHGYDEVLLAADFPHGLGDRRFDVVLDPIGGQVRRQNLHLVAPHGRLVLFGNIATAEPVTLTSEDLLAEGRSVLSYKGILLPRTYPRRFQASVLAALEPLRAGSVRVTVGAEYELADVEAAVSRLASGAAVGKTVIRIGARQPTN
jgi:NADPH2:quinone reductase